MERTLKTAVKLLNEQGFSTTEDGVVTYNGNEFPMKAVIVPLIEGNWNFSMEHIVNQVTCAATSAYEFQQSLTNKIQ